MPAGMQGESFGTEPYGMRGESFGTEPYGMQGQSFDPFGAPTGRGPGVSGLAVASLIFGLIGGIPLSLLFGIIALVKIRRTRQRGKGMAIAGLVLSGLWAVSLAVVVVGVVQVRTNAAASYDFQPGQCFNRASVNTAGPSTPVDCAQPHVGEVYAVETVRETTYPGKTAVEAFAHSTCPGAVITALPAGKNHPDIAIAYLIPQDKSWALGDRTVKCFFHRRDDQPMTGLVKDTGVPYTDDQNRYLRVSQPYDAIVREQIDAKDWLGERDVIKRSIPLVQKEIDVLKAGPWPADAKAAIDALVAAKGLELADRQRAAIAVNQGTINLAMLDVDLHSGAAEKTDAVRAALHLQPLH
jgi:hypothetical protein